WFLDLFFYLAVIFFFSFVPVSDRARARVCLWGGCACAFGRRAFLTLKQKRKVREKEGQWARIIRRTQRDST
ncbi:hypothetical protein DFJ73DRAFT_855920, partial [Zopfochytrium polystomum]